MNASITTTQPTPTPMTRRQRIATFNARHSHELFSIARSFVERFGPAFPAVKRIVQLEDKTSRFDFACVVSVLCKNADNFESVAPMIESIGEKLQAHGFTPAMVPSVKVAFLGALRDCCGPEWTAETERDWTEICGEFCACMNLRGAAKVSAPAPLSMAA